MKGERCIKTLSIALQEVLPLFFFSFWLLVSSTSTASARYVILRHVLIHPVVLFLLLFILVHAVHAVLRHPKRHFSAPTTPIRVVGIGACAFWTVTVGIDRAVIGWLRSEVIRLSLGPALPVRVAIAIYAVIAGIVRSTSSTRLSLLAFCKLLMSLREQKEPVGCCTSSGGRRCQIRRVVILLALLLVLHIIVAWLGHGLKVVRVLSTRVVVVCAGNGVESVRCDGLGSVRVGVIVVVHKRKEGRCIGRRGREGDWAAYEGSEACAWG
jgi:hypothetical protein